MVDEQEPAKRVVKRVVRKTVVRPVPPAEAKPQMRYGRPVATATKPQARVASRSGGAGTKPVSAPAGKVAPQAPRQRVDVRAKLHTARETSGRVWWAVADRAGDGARTGSRFVVARVRTVAAWRLPHINLYLASIITGAVVGIVSVALGALSLTIFAGVRGVSSGGGFWGGLAFTAIAVAALALGEAMLRGFGSLSARLTSFLAVVLAIVAMLGLFLDLADSWAAVGLLPVLGAVSFALSHWLIDLAENTPAVID